MKNWISRNLRNIIAIAFIIPILLVAGVSISHVTEFYGLSNPMSWAIYLSVAIEIAALSALAAVSVKMGRFVYLPFFVVTLIQMIGNIFFSFSYIDETGQTFQDWVAMVGGVFEGMGVEKTDINTHKTIIAFFSGGLLPIISLTFAHMLVMFTEKNQDTDQVPTNNRPSTDQVEELTTEEARRLMEEKIRQEEEIKYKPTPEDLEKIEEIVKVKYTEPEDVLHIKAGEFVNLEHLQNITTHDTAGVDGVMMIHVNPISGEPDFDFEFIGPNETRTIRSTDRRKIIFCFKEEVYVNGVELSLLNRMRLKYHSEVTIETGAEGACLVMERKIATAPDSV